jgi:hypothetical protein
MDQPHILIALCLAVGGAISLLIRLGETRAVVELLRAHLPPRIFALGPVARWLVAGLAPVPVAIVAHLEAGLSTYEAVVLALGAVVAGQGLHLGPRAIAHSKVAK